MQYNAHWCAEQNMLKVKMYTQFSLLSNNYNLEYFIAILLIFKIEGFLN